MSYNHYRGFAFYGYLEHELTVAFLFK
ncbi:protein of unknown function [Xenorhabdus nematophila AN6/1]|nr:protein of unknown function [Xenorhabdus nematophila AN6/1]